MEDVKSSRDGQVKELIAIRENERGEQLVSARELHRFLGIATRFNDWIENRIKKYEFIEDYDYTKILVRNSRGRKYDYAVKLDVAKELSMVENNSRGREARVYFIQCEKKLKVAQGKLPKTYLEALKELVKLEETKLSLENRVNNLVHSRKLYTTTEIAKELGLKSANALNQLLEEDKIQYKVNGTWVLYSKYSDKEYVSIKQTELENGKIIYDRKWTGLGRNFLIERYSGTVKRD